jgi:RND family efflux transporter MFP subunit
MPTAHASTPRRRGTSHVARALAAGTLAVTTLAACKRGDANAATDSAAAAAAAAVTTVSPENVAVVRNDTVQSGPALSGTLQPERQATLRAEVTGTVVTALAEAGQRVGRGAVLARIETAGLGEASISARAAVTTAQGQSELAQRNLERSRRLLAAGAIAQRDLETAQTQADAARAQLQAARAQSAQAQRTLGNATVTAPFAGIVGTRSVNTGDVVNVGAPLYTVVDPGSMQLAGSVPADQLAQVRVGAPVRFTVTGYPDRAFLGRITRVAPVADPTTRQVQIIASIPNAGNQLVGGLFAEGRVSSESRLALVAPLDAVDQRGVRPAVLRVKGGRVERVPIELGLRDEARETVELRGGVAAGDTLLRASTQGLAVGTAVRVAGIGDAPAARSTGAATGVGAGTGAGATGTTNGAGGGASGAGAPR